MWIRLRRCSAKWGVEAPISWRTSSTVGSRSKRPGCSNSLTRGKLPRVLLPMAVRKQIAAGEVDLAFRRWRRPTVKAGGTLRTPMGVLAIDAVDAIEPEDITDADARRAGHAEPRGGARRAAAGGHALPDRVPPGRTRSPGGVARADRPHRRGATSGSRRGCPGPGRSLELIADQPATLAADLAAQRGQERLAFKRDVRKLKELGLTESLQKGYRLSPRGRAFLSGARR